MAINTRKKGSAWEYKVRDYLKSKGCFVTRSTVSKFPDLIALLPLGHTDINIGISKEFSSGYLFIECKSRKSGLNRKEKEQFKYLKSNYDIECLVAYPKYSIYSSKKNNIIFEEVN